MGVDIGLLFREFEKDAKKSMRRLVRSGVLPKDMDASEKKRYFAYLVSMECTEYAKAVPMSDSDRLAMVSRVESFRKYAK